VTHRTIDDNTVTLRHRDTQKQHRMTIDDILKTIQSSLV
jgi:Glycyl-tRNA synthetase (class II)